MFICSLFQYVVKLGLQNFSANYNIRIAHYHRQNGKTMKYIEVVFNLTNHEDFVKDLLANHLADIGFESFSDEEGVFRGFIQKKDFDETTLQNAVRSFDFADGISYTATEAEDKDWNEEWERNCFQPLVIEDKCVVHATFHKDFPKAEHDILIDPKMAFGTGHHATTSLMLHFLLDADLQGKSVLDMGCGTAILSILAAQKNATKVTAIDIDEWAYENAKENIRLNNAEQINVLCGGAEAITGGPFNVILANINRNILLNDIHLYQKHLAENGELFLSGFYEEDVPLIAAECAKYGLQQQEVRTDNRWTAVRFKKP